LRAVARGADRAGGDRRGGAPRSEPRTAHAVVTKRRRRNHRERTPAMLPDSDELDLSALRFEPLSERPSKVFLNHLAQPASPGATMGDWLDSLPGTLAANGLKRLRDAIVRAHHDGRPVIAALGGHVVKTGCTPYLVDWMQRGVLTGLALNGSAAIHDLELAI